MILSLSSGRWSAFKTFYGKPELLPEQIRNWQRAIGQDDEEERWRELSDQILHQLTITDAAYAVVPHVVRDLARVQVGGRLEYVVELGLIEAARQEKSAPALPDDLTAGYLSAVEQARRFAIECLYLPLPKEKLRYLVSTLASLFGHGVLGDLLFNLDCLCGECPRCGATVYPDEVHSSGYV